MKSLVEACAPLAEGQKAALISLLGDEDNAIYEMVRKKILSYGPVAAQWLSRYTLSNDPVTRRRAREIVDHFALQSADRHFLGFCLSQGEQFDIEQGSLLLSRTQYPNTNAEAYSALLDSFAAELRSRLDLKSPPNQILNTINSYLYDDLKFAGSEQNYYDPQNSYLSRVLDRRTGNPISLCLVYLLLARRLRLPMVGIGLPGHFVCRFQNPQQEIYVDAFNRGQLLTKSDCIKYLVQVRHQFDENFLEPATPRRMLLRTCANLHQIYTQVKNPKATERLQHYLIALAK